MSVSDNKICRVCGYKFVDFYPWGLDGQTPTFDYCPCCFTEFGYDDTTINAVRETRQKWINSGAVWYDPKKKPRGWDLNYQLKNIPESFR